MIGRNLYAFVGCNAGAISLGEYRSGLLDAGFAQVEIIDTKADLKIYSKNEDREMACCGGTPCGSDADMAARAQLVELMKKYNINDYAASVKVDAVKHREW